MSQMLIFLLMFIAVTVCVKLSMKMNAWRWIIAYWAVLSIKNMIDFMR